MAVKRTCEDCAKSIEGKSPKARFCDDACRKRFARRSDSTRTESGPDEDSTRTHDDLKLIATTVAALEAAGAVDTVAGQAALVLARDLAYSRYGSGAHASLVDRLLKTMAEIAPAKPAADSPVETIRGRGAARRTNPAGLRIVS